MNIDVYDFDKTIYDGDSSIDFYLYCMRLNKKIIFRIPSFLFSFFCYKLKGTSKERMKENFDLFDFTLTPEDMVAIETLDSGESLFFSHYDPKTVEWFMSIV